VTLLAQLDAFYTEHHRCGTLEGGVGETVVRLRLRRSDRPPLLMKATHLT
jgi:hypothetical protein